MSRGPAPSSKRQKPAAAGADDAVPSFVPPCLAKLADAPPDGDDWVHEIKYDGYRLQAHINRGSVRLLTRSGQDWTDRFASLASAFGKLKLQQAIIDGEVVVEDDSGASSFVKLVGALKASRSDEMIFYAFDVLYLAGDDVRTRPLSDRRMILERALSKSAKACPIKLSRAFAGHGREMLEAACRLGLEGIISKRLSVPYRSGRGGDWLKAKCIQNDEFVIGGYLDSKAYAQSVGALALGYFERGKLRYAGRVGTGFNAQSAREIWKRLQPLKISKSPFETSLTTAERRLVQWVNPTLVAQIEYRALTESGILRHASFLALRDDKPARSVHRAGAAKLKKK